MNSSSDGKRIRGRKARGRSTGAHASGRSSWEGSSRIQGEEARTMVEDYFPATYCDGRARFLSACLDARVQVAS